MKRSGDQWATISFDQPPKKHGPHRSSSCNVIATLCPGTTAKLYDYADDAKDEKEKNILERLIIYDITSRSGIFHLYGNVTIDGKGLQNLDLCSALRAFKQGEIFIVPNLL
jgi:hypothetical protein